jgi:A/G-specific adenine glycosylase
MASREKFFVEQLINWFDTNKRAFSWRKLSLTPFQALLAELMLQKTNANQVEKMFGNFIARYPDPKSILNLKQETLSNILQPLGLFNRRARDLKKISEIIHKNDDNLPSEKSELLKLPGVGNYIANAVLCFVFEQKVPMIDANVGRVMKRFYSFPVKGAPSRDRKLEEKMTALMPDARFKDFNLALIDLAALICIPRNPLCSECPLNLNCDYFKKINQDGDKN